MMFKKFLLAVFIVFFINHLHAQKLVTKNIVLVTIDGFRWQELFNGADSALMRQQTNYVDPIGIKNHFWDNEVNRRRRILLPFFWSVMSSSGQIYGNRNFDNKVNVTNKFWFSYPGYNELLTGHADDKRINSNDKLPNPNTTVLEYINYQRGYKDRVAVFAGWDCFPYIINARRNGILVSAGITDAFGNKLTDNEKLLNKLMPSIPNPLNGVRLDAFTFYFGLEYMKKEKPRVIYFAFDETDDFAHQGEYGAYLNAAHDVDGFLKELWEYVNDDPFYKNSTTMIITADHGRGQAATDWTSHGKNISGSDQVWLAVIGPDCPPKGEVRTPGQIYQNQVARTISTLLGFDYSNNGQAGKTIEQIFVK